MKLRPIVIILATLLTVSAVSGVCPLGDLDENCRVDIYDLRIFTQQWLEIAECSGPGCADFDGIGRIDGSDFSLFALDWRKDHRIFWLAINEFMASNNSESGISDEHGDYDDWIEIYNSWPEQLDVGGLYITDDLDEPTKWRIPSNAPAYTTIDPNGYIVLWADNETSEGVLHLPFKLDAGGEAIGLFASDGSTLLDSIEFVDQTANISFGRTPDGNEHWQYMVVATPAAENNDAYIGIVGDTEFSHNRGFYEAPFNVILATETSGASIYYTTDGNAPIINEMPAAGAMLYSGPIPITTTTCLRAGAIKTGYKATNVDAQTYIFLSDVKQQSNSSAYSRGFPVWWVNKYGDVTNSDYTMDPDVVNNPSYSGVFTHAMKAIPTISLSTDMKHLFNKMTGIYVNPGEYHNPDLDQDWERPVSAEYFDPCTGDQFQINGGVRIVGNQSRWTLNPKHSFRLTFTTEYGPTKLEFPLFENTDIETHNTISLRSQYHVSWVSASGDPPVIVGSSQAQYLRDTFAQDSIRDMGYLSPDSKLVHLYVNGMYWGIYQASERPDDDFMAEHLGGAPDDYEVVEGIIGGVDGVEHKDALGDQTWHYIWNYITAHNYDNPVSDSEYAVIEQYIDMTQMVDYIIYMTWAVNWDWCSKNWYAASLRGPLGQPPAGKWRFYPWDSEITLQWYSQMHGIPFSGYYDAGPGRMHNAMHQNQQYNRLFGDRVQKLCANGGVLTTQPCVERYQKRAELIEDAVIGESARWGDFAQDQNGSSSPLYTRDDHWTPQRDWLVNTFFPGKTSYIIGAYRNEGLYPTVSAPVFNVNGSYKHGGYISATDQLSMTASAGTIYYTLDGNDVVTSLPPGGPGEPNITILVMEPAAKKVWVPDSNIGTTWRGGSEPYNDSGWRSGTGGVGYATGTAYDPYDPYIGIDVEPNMYNKMGSCYIRIPFNVDSSELAGYTSLKLRVRYDDGFVAFINGSQVTSANPASPLEWNSLASALHDDSLAVQLEDFSISSHLNKLHAGSNILAIHGLNQQTGSSDFLISVELQAITEQTYEPNVSPSAIQYAGPFTIDRSRQVKARALSSGQWSALNDAVYVVGPVVSNLRISEIMYHPLDVNTEYVELKNIGAISINLNLVRFTNGIDFTFGPNTLAANEHILVVEDKTAFEAKYGTWRNVAGEYIGSLDNAGERIRLEDALGGTILDFDYKDGWRPITDGDGYSLTAINPANPDPNSWFKKDSWRASAYVNGSPGWDDSGIIPNPGSIVINEVMSHSHAYAPDWIELYNTTGNSINIAGWFLSDSDTNIMKYEFKSGTTIGPYGYVLIYEDVNFGPDANYDPGRHVPFALSENGDMVCLSSGLDANGLLTGYRTTEDFGASATGVSFGRYYKASTASYNFVPMDHNTPHTANAYPKVGPIIITEIMYHPDWPASGSYSNDEYEYIELNNITASPVTLYDYNVNLPWKFTDGIDYTFPSPPNDVTIPAGGHILVVRNRAAFEARYGTGHNIAGEYTGWLANDGEQLQLGQPGDIDEFGTRQYIRVERIDYSDGSHPGGEPGDVDLWPTLPDGSGKSLSRISNTAYANDPNNWTSANPSPGS